jgi:hypothetical protein
LNSWSFYFSLPSASEIASVHFIVILPLRNSNVMNHKGMGKCFRKNIEVSKKKEGKRRVAYLPTQVAWKRSGAKNQTRLEVEREKTLDNKC